MEVRTQLAIATLATALFGSSLAYASTDRHGGRPDEVDGWQKISVPAGPIASTGVNGEPREIVPGCALSSSTDGVKSDFSFFYRPGKKEKLAVFFNGGGACWDYTTCVASLQSQLPTYVPAMDASNTPVGAGGMFDLSRDDNPFKDWSIVFVPYCTGDIHWGSQDVTYTDPTGQGPATTIHHRGFDNFLVVRDWIKRRFTERQHGGGTSSDVNKLVVTGSSAGAYGASLAFPYLKQTIPGAKGYMLGDAGNGVINDSFYTQALSGTNAVWAVRKNLPTWVPGIDNVLDVGAYGFLPAYYSTLAHYYGKDRFAQYTTNWDAVQALFYNIMENTQNPAEWVNLTPEVFGTWNYLMTQYTSATAGNSNYRYFVEPGCNHTLMRDPEFYSSTSAGGTTTFQNWLKGMIGMRSVDNWTNVGCSFDTCPPPADAATVGACVTRGLGG